MAQKKISLKQLQKAVAKERKNLKIVEERRKLERELKQLRAGASTKLLKRFGRGFVVLSKKGGKAAVQGAKAIQEFGEKRGAAEFFDTPVSGRSHPRTVVRRRKPVRRKTTRRTIRRRATSQQDTGFFGGLPQIGI